MTNNNNDLIHPTAIIEDGAQIGQNVSIGAYSIVEKNVKLGDNVSLSHHVIITGNTTIGNNCQVYPFTSIGTPPQDLKYKGENSTITIGDNNIFREHVTVNPGTEGGIMKTTIGNNCLFMVGSHVAHDCIVGDNVILANNATLAGHVEVGDFAIIGGLSAIRQFVRIGSHAMIGGMSGIESDVIPYGQAVGERASLTGLNLIGLKRRGFSRDDIHSLRSAYRLMFSPEGTLSERVNDV
ncbi:MAG: acyl-ACP--UDP-N-acetylglucosamine O-acyltransferase, partial [Rickettsiales bacterium]|nr:acyl-ACP--UDP-N-acetylglucosamine O-acyltransferase [Rickettsiales bacterium]